MPRPGRVLPPPVDAPRPGVFLHRLRADRPSVVASLEHAPAWRTYVIDEVRLIRSGWDSATLVYVGTAYREGGDPAFTGVMSSVYRHLDGAWRLAVYQQTPIPPID